MKKKIVLVVILGLLLSGCGNKNNVEMPNGTDTLVSLNNGSNIKINDVYEKLKNSFGTSVVLDMIDQTILEEKYKDDLDNATDYSVNALESMRTYFENDNQYLSYIQKTYGYNDFDEFQSALKLNYLRNNAVKDYAKSQITESQIKKYYKSDIKEDREVKHIQIIPDVNDNMTSDEKTEKENEALEKAKEVIARLKKGESFDDLAKEYSQDDSTKNNGGNLGNINKGFYGSEEFDKEMYSLNANEFSNTPVKTTKGYEILYIVELKEKKSLDELRDSIVDTLSEDLINEDSTVEINALVELRKSYGVTINDDSLNRNINKYINQLIESAKINNVNK